MYYRVPQKRERLILVAVRNDLADKARFSFPKPHEKIMTLKDGLKKGELYNCDVPQSIGQIYPAKKKAVLDLVPPGGCWRNLPDDIQRAYMKKSYFLSGGRTGMARRLSWDEASLTLTCSPAQNQTERCHPDETRPLTVREYARIQTFPDNWEFKGTMAAQYKQIGNAVPVNLAHAVGKNLIYLLRNLENSCA
jgi:DNA (cytosine-5)-methyltransferase 1